MAEPGQAFHLEELERSKQVLHILYRPPKSNGQVTVLARVPWQTSWEYTFDFANQKTATPTGQDGSVGDVVFVPKGGPQPILGGPIANETIKAGFRP